MTGRPVALDTWSRAEQFRFFRGFERPHFATTARVDVSRLMANRKRHALSPFRHTIWAVGVALHADPELRMRFQGDAVTEYATQQLSPTLTLANGDFRYTYLTFDADRAAFDAHAETEIAAVREGAPLNANDGSLHNVAYLSCLPWLNYTALDNALPGPDDCIPRVSWGKIVATDGGHDMAMSLQVHHALVDGRQVGAFFESVQDALNDVG